LICHGFPCARYELPSVRQLRDCFYCGKSAKFRHRTSVHSHFAIAARGIHHRPIRRLFPQRDLFPLPQPTDFPREADFSGEFYAERLYTIWEGRTST
jgi:hypothetical protein